MKKLFAAILALCLMLSVAAAETVDADLRGAQAGEEEEKFLRAPARASWMIWRITGSWIWF